MGQYYFIVNLDKREYLRPHKFGDGLKLMEFGQSAGGILLGLTILLADGNGRGIGDCGDEQPNSIIGSWAGDKIVIAGDYADPNKFVPAECHEELFAKCLKSQNSRIDIEPNSKMAHDFAWKKCNLFSFAEYFCKDISDEVITILRANNQWLRSDK